METKQPDIPEALRAFLSPDTPLDIAQRYAGLPLRAKSADFGTLDTNVVVVDTETTGFSFTHDCLIQIAAARLEKGFITDWFVTFVNPGKPIPDDIVYLTGITDTDVLDAPTPEEALSGLVAFAGDATMVAHNVSFDKTFITQEPAGAALAENLWVDTLDLARITLPRMKSHRLIDLVRAFEAPVSTHRADADVAATCALYRLLLAAVDAMPLWLIAAIAELAPVEQWSTGAVFLFLSRKKTAQDNMAAQTQEEARQGCIREFRAQRACCSTVQALRKKVDAEAIAADPKRHFVMPSPKDIHAAFQEGGIASVLFDAFELRPQQEKMSLAVREAFERGENLAVEAGTGVGKSLAYLIPAVLLAKNNDIGVGVATKTNALLDQLMYQDLPVLAKEFDNLTYAALKGFIHYPCLRKIEGLISNGVETQQTAQTAETKQTTEKKPSQAPAFAALLSFIEQTEYDDIDALKLDYRALPRWLFTSTSRECHRRACPFYYKGCFVHGARRRAACADIVVTNISLLFCDLAAEGALLPPVRYWVIDEAHAIEAEARKSFSLSIESSELMRLSRRVSAGTADKDVIVRTMRALEKLPENPQRVQCSTLLEKATVQARTFANAAQNLAYDFKKLLTLLPVKKARGYEKTELWISSDIRATDVFCALATKGKALIDVANPLVVLLSRINALLEDTSVPDIVRKDLAIAILDIKDLLSAVNSIFVEPSDSFVYAATLFKSKDRLTDKLEALPFDVGPTLNKTLFMQTHSVIFTSATLTVDNSFSSFAHLIGLNEEENSQTGFLQLDSCYNFDANMTIFIPSDLPDPTEPSYLEKLQQFLILVHRAQQGSMLTLFTNRREMEQCFAKVQPALKKDNLRLACQKWGVSVKGLRDDFLNDEHLSLFALKSFWEGFDAPGATLKGVVIPRLPFARPTDPLSREREARNPRAWAQYVLPKTALEVKQAAGRLIRSADDTGVLILADHRLLTKSYKDTILNSLPGQNIQVATCEQIVEYIEYAPA